MKYILLLLTPLLCFSQTVWNGTQITFSKADNADYTNAQHQDRITDDVWLTRLSGGGLINIKDESDYYDGVSPSGTLWAVGNSSSSNLSFDDFKNFYGPSGNKPPLNTQVVLKLTKGTTTASDDIHIDVTFTSWTSGQRGYDGGGGGFTYTRSTNPNLSVEGVQSEDIFVYPNPTSGVVQANQDIISKIHVYDLTGKQLMNTNTSSFDLSSVNNGMYLIRLYRKDNNEWVTRRVVKQ